MLYDGIASHTRTLFLKRVMSSVKIRYMELLAFEAKKSAPNQIVLTHVGGFYEAVGASAMYLYKAYGYTPMKIFLNGYGCYVRAGFSDKARLKPDTMLKKVYTFPHPRLDAPDTCVYELPAGEECPPQSVVDQFLAAATEYHQLTAARHAVAQQSLDLFSQAVNNTSAPAPAPAPAPVPAPVAVVKKEPVTSVPVPKRVHKLPQEPNSLPIIIAATRFISFWNTSVLKRLDVKVRNRYDRIIQDTLFQIKTLCITLYESKNFATQVDRHQLYMRLGEQLAILYTTLDTLERDRYLHTRQMQVLIGLYIDMKKNLLVWRRAS